MKKNKFRKIAQEVILSEIKSLQKLKSSIGIDFNKVVEAIINCKRGKIILSGVGKSGIIAKKYHLHFPQWDLHHFLLTQALVHMET